MYAFGICIDRHYLTPGLATIASLADSLSPRARKAAALRLLSFDLGPPQALLLAHLAKRAGFGSFALARRSPLRTARMATSDRPRDHHRLSVTAHIIRSPV
ncbi:MULTISPECIES: hypothetical protein [Streptomyces]|uniref:hypothetical protein n=1 Tax=Streptomyces TaxID=1883 RepID=UPI0016726AE0|nr:MULTISPECIES: hypothetical protein [Streptomyces]MBK3523183.1 hypothetical protein [Streptomyces sp. MBT70]GGR94695.1 hypothetical protein GCM10010236_56560 [Streptomyces eurythermus]